MKTNLLKTALVAALIVLSTNAKAFTAVVSGSWSSSATWGGVGPGASVSNQDVIIPTGITVNLDQDVSFNGIVNSFTVDGTLSSSTNNNIWISGGALAGSGTISIHRLSFNSLLSTNTFAGTMNLFSLQNQGSTLTFTALGNVSDTLDLDGGSIAISSGGNLSLAAYGNIRVNDGTLSSTGGVFTTTSAYDVWYVGSSKTTGLEVNSSNLRNLHMNLSNNLQILTQGLGNLTVNGVMDAQTGRYDFSGSHLTLKGDLMQSLNAFFVSSAASDLTISGTGYMTDAMVFTSASSVNTLELDRTAGNFKLGSSLSIAGTLFLTNGPLRLDAGTLTMNSGSMIQVADGNFLQTSGVFNGAASYNVNFIGGSHTAAIELSGTGLNNVMVGMSSGYDTLILGTAVVVNGNLTMNVGMMALNGYNLTLNGGFSQMQYAYFIGDLTSSMYLNLTSTGDTIYFGGSGKDLDNLGINITAGASILLATDLTIHNNLNLVNGKLEITNSNLHFSSTGTVLNYDDTHYIMTSGSGQVEMQVNSNSTYVTFPIGFMAGYSPVKIQQTSTGTTGMFRVRAMNGVYANGTTGYNAATTESVVNKTWDIDAANGVIVNMNLKLDWQSADEVNGFNRAQSHIAKYNNNWDTYTTSAAVPAANNTYESTRSAVTSTGLFAVIDTSVVLTVHEVTVPESMEVYPNPAVDFVTVKNPANAAFTYELYDATGKVITVMTNENSVNTFDVGSYSTGIYFLRIVNNETNAVVTKRIIKQ